MRTGTLRVLHSSVEPNYRTPPALVDKLWQAAGGFDLDLAADWDSAVVALPGGKRRGESDTPRYLGPDNPVEGRRDALQVPWHLHGRRGFLNPPYSKKKIEELYKALKDAREEGQDPQSLKELAARTRTQIAMLRIEHWARKAYEESLQGFSTWGLFPYAPQTEWFREYVMGHQRRPKATGKPGECVYPLTGWSGHAALDYWRIPHRVSYLAPDGTPIGNNAGVNSCIIIWGENPGWVGPWTPSGRYWSYR